MTAQKIADKVGVTKNQVHEVYKRYKMTTKQNPTFELNMLQKQLLYSGILGDGRLKRNGKHNVYYSECHALQEQEYCKWKYKAFGSLTSGMNMYDKNRNNNSCDAIEFCTKTTPTLIKYLDMQEYKDDAIDRINEVGLTIFVLDDGWFNPHSKKGNFLVAGGVLTDPQLEKLCDKYREFGFGDAHIIGKASHDISLPSSANKYIYYIATKLMPESTDIIQKKFGYMYETGQIFNYEKLVG